MKHKTMVNLRKWRDNLTIDTPIITREGIKGIVCSIDGRKILVMFGKGHNRTEHIDDLFPIDWEEIVIGWCNKKQWRDTDIPIDKVAKKKCKQKRKKQSKT